MIRFWLNGEQASAADGNRLLLDFLRDQAHLKGTHAACREGDCGSCQILLCEDPEGDQPQFRAHTSCLVRVADVEHCHVVTIEGVRGLHPATTPHPLLTTVADAGASQCGFCSPGLVIALLNWLLNGNELTVAEGEHWINGSLCRCTGYMGQRRALQQLAHNVGAELRHCPHRLTRLIEWQWLPQWMQFPAPLLAAATPDITTPAESTTTAFIAGGTDSMLEQPQATTCYRSVLARHDEPPMRSDEQHIWLNARSPIQQVSAALVRAHLLPVFATFNHLFASLPIRNRATLGGNLAHASPVADSIPLLLVLDAILHTNLRHFSVHDLVTGFKQTCLQPDEIIQWIAIPREVETGVLQFDKVSRRGTTDIAVVNCASFYRVVDGKIIEARIALGGATAVALRLLSLEAALQQQSPSSPIERLIDAYLQPLIAPVSDLRGSERYRRLLARQLILAQWLQVQSSPAYTRQEQLSQEQSPQEPFHASP